jgi:hypothetical protein
MAIKNDVEPALAAIYGYEFYRIAAENWGNCDAATQDSTSEGFSQYQSLAAFAIAPDSDWYSTSFSGSGIINVKNPQRWPLSPVAPWTTGLPAPWKCTPYDFQAYGDEILPIGNETPMLFGPTMGTWGGQYIWGGGVPGSYQPEQYPALRLIAYLTPPKYAPPSKRDALRDYIRPTPVDYIGIDRSDAMKRVLCVEGRKSVRVSFKATGGATARPVLVQVTAASGEHSCDHSQKLFEFDLSGIQTLTPQTATDNFEFGISDLDVSWLMIRVAEGAEAFPRVDDPEIAWSVLAYD